MKVKRRELTKRCKSLLTPPAALLPLAKLLPLVETLEHHPCMKLLRSQR